MSRIRRTYLDGLTRPAVVARAERSPSPTVTHGVVARKKDASTGELFIYDEISCWGISAQLIADSLRELGPVDNLTVHVNSPGGDVFDGIAIGNLLRDHSARVTVVVDALAASIASVISMAADEVIMGRNSSMMIHDAAGFAFGNAGDMRELAKLLDMISDNISTVYADRAGGDPADWRKVMKGEKWYSAQEAVDAGLADKVAPLAERDEAAATARVRDFDLTAFAHVPSSVRNDSNTTQTPPDEAPPVTDPPAVVELDAPTLDAPPEVDDPFTWSMTSGDFRDAILSAEPEPVTVDLAAFREACVVAAHDVASPTAIGAPVLMPVRRLPMAPDAVVDPDALIMPTADELRAAVRGAANDVALPVLAGAGPPVVEDEPSLSLDLPALQRSLREARF